MRRKRTGYSGQHRQQTPHASSGYQRSAYRKYRTRRHRQIIVLAVAGLLLSGALYLGGLAFSFIPWQAIAQPIQTLMAQLNRPEPKPADMETVLRQNLEEGKLPGAYAVVAPTAEEVEQLSPKDKWQLLLISRLSFLSHPSFLYAGRLDTFLPKRSTASPLLPIISAQADYPLQDKLAALFSQYGHLKPHLYYYNPQRKAHVDIGGMAAVPAASVIKVPILMLYLQYLDEQRLRFDSPLPYLDYHRAGGSGGLQYQPAGVELPANAVATEMIRISDNTSTNILISALGGMETVNHRLRQLGLKDTQIRNPLPDLDGTNTISPYEIVTMLYNLEYSPLLSDLARYNGLGILETTKNNRLLPAQLPQDLRVAHKTGDIGTSLGDSGIVYLPDGNRYFLSIQVERPFNDYSAKELIQQTSRLIYDHNVLQAQQQQMLTNR